MLQQIGQPTSVMLPPEHRVLAATMNWSMVKGGGWQLDPQVIAYDAAGNQIEGMRLHHSFKVTKDGSLALDPVHRTALVNLDGLAALANQGVCVARVGFEITLFAGSIYNLTFADLTRAMLEIGDRYNLGHVLAQHFHTGPHPSHRLSLGDLVAIGDGNWAFTPPSR